MKYQKTIKTFLFLGVVIMSYSFVSVREESLAVSQSTNTGNAEKVYVKTDIISPDGMALNPSYNIATRN